MQMTICKVLCADHTFKICKGIVHQGKKAFEGLFSIMNEKGQIVAYWLVPSSKMEAVESKMKLFAKRLENQWLEIYL